MKNNFHTAFARKFVVVLLVVPVFLLSACSKPVPTQSTFSMGNRTASITVPASDAAQLHVIRERVQRQYAAAWKDLDVNDPFSDVSKINRVAGTYRLQVAYNAFRALDLAHYYSQLTGGAYDLTLLPALEAWGFQGPVPESPPDEDECAALLELIGPRHLQFADQGAVAILSPGTRIAPEGLPYALGVDLALVELRSQESPPALLSWDRYMRAHGRPSKEKRWQQSVRNPFGSGALGEIALEPNHALAIIGLRDRTVTIGNQTFGGIIDPRTARPAEGVALVAVRAPTCIMANALAHALIVLGREEGAHLLNEFPECEVLLVPDQQPIEAWATEGWIAAFSQALPAPIRRWERPALPVESIEEPSAER